MSKPVKTTAETAEATAVEQGLKAHYAMCKRIDELEQQIEVLTKERMSIVAGINRLTKAINPHATDPINLDYPKPITAGIETLASRLRESVDYESI